MKKLIARIKVLLGAMPTYLTVAGVVVMIVTTEIADAIPGEIGTWAVKIGGYIGTVIAVATAIVRKVTPVLDSQTGLLGPKVKTVTVGPPPPDK